MVIIHFAAIVLHSVANNQIVDMQQHVVNRDLVEDFLGNGNVGCLVLDNHQWLGLQIV